MARVAAMTSPKMSSHSTGWTARWTSSYGSCRTLRTSISAMAAVSTRKVPNLVGLAHATGRAAGASDLTIGTSFFELAAREMGKDIAERPRRARSAP